MASLVRGIRNVERAMGDGVKKNAQRLNVRISLWQERALWRKRDIKQGEVFTEENITTKRPGNGVSPMKWYEVLGTKAVRDFGEDELICLK